LSIQKIIPCTPPDIQSNHWA